MESMFAEAKLTEPPFNFDTSSVTTMEACSESGGANHSANFDTPSVTTMATCSRMRRPQPLVNFSHVERDDHGGMFESAFVQPPPQLRHVERVINMDDVHGGVVRPVLNFNTPSVTTMEKMFYHAGVQPAARTSTRRA